MIEKDILMKLSFGSNSLFGFIKSPKFLDWVIRTMTEFEFFNLSHWNSSCFEFPRVCRHMLNSSLRISDTGCHSMELCRVCGRGRRVKSATSIGCHPADVS
jgi:hypothetical protein